MTTPHQPSTEDRLPPSRLVRWVLLGGIILFSVGLYFQFGLRVPPIGTTPAGSTTTSTP